MRYSAKLNTYYVSFQMVMLKPEFEMKLSFPLLPVGGVYVRCRPLQLRQPVLVLAANQGRRFLPVSTLRVTAGKAGFFSTTIKCMLQLIMMGYALQFHSRLQLLTYNFFSGSCLMNSKNEIHRLEIGRRSVKE